MRVLAIDPGNIESAWVIFEKVKRSIRLGMIFEIIACGKELNDDALDRISKFNYDVVVIEEMVAYGKWSGREVTDTAFWVGRFYQESHKPVSLINRSKVRWHIGKQRKVTDATVIEKLIERFCPKIHDEYLSGRITKPVMINKAREIYFKNFKEDIWQAFALGVCWHDLNEN